MERKVISYKSVVDKMNELRNVVYDSEKRFLGCLAEDAKRACWEVRTMDLSKLSAEELISWAKGLEMETAAELMFGKGDSPERLHSDILFFRLTAEMYNRKMINNEDVVSGNGGIFICANLTPWERMRMIKNGNNKNLDRGRRPYISTQL